MTARPDPREHEPNNLGELLSGERLRALVREETGLWPLVAVIAIVSLTVVTSLLVLALGSRSVAAMGAVALLALMSVLIVDGDRRRRGRTGPLLWIALAFWLVSGGAAYALLGWGVG